MTMIRARSISAEVSEFIQPLLGKAVCRQQVGDGRSLSIGFGQKVFHSNPKKKDIYYGEWEIGTYTAAWRIIREDQIVIGSQDLFETLTDFDQALHRVMLPPIQVIEQSSNFDIRVVLSGGLSLEFLCASASDDEMFHIFAPDSKYLEFTCKHGWKIGAADAPWD